MFVSERFPSSPIKVHGKHPVYTDVGTWHPLAGKFLKLNYRIQSSLEKNLIERTLQYIKDRTGVFDDYFPCRRANCKLNIPKLVESVCISTQYQYNKEMMA